MKQFTNFVFNYPHYLDVNLLQIGEEYCAPLYSFGPAVRHNYMFHYVISGKGSFYTERLPQIDNATYQIKSGEGFLIIPDTRHYYVADEEDPWHYIWIEFTGAKAVPFLNSCGLSTDSLIYKPKDYTMLTNNALIEHLMFILNNPKASQQAIIGHLYLFFDTLMTYVAPQSCIDTRQSDKSYIAEATRYIGHYYQSIKSVEEIAEYCNLSRNYLGKLFKDTLRITLQEYLIQFRLNRSAELMLSSDLNICEISELVGYTNELNYSRAFKKMFHVSPRDWRKQSKLHPK